MCRTGERARGQWRAWRHTRFALSRVPPGGRAAACRKVRGKSGLHETGVAGNARPVAVLGWRPRESATESKPPMACLQVQARVKGCGKSAPGLRQRGPHGKPHPEQGRIGAARWKQQVRFASTARVGCSSCGAIRGLDEWLPPRGRCASIPRAGQNPAYRLPGKPVAPGNNEGSGAFSGTSCPSTSSPSNGRQASFISSEWR